jgi:DNA-binding transcriptional ArsR family regulator
MVIKQSPALDRVFHALADPTRRGIVERLARGERTVMDLARDFTISQPAVTKHLNVLAKAEIITRRREGRRRFCRLRPASLDASLGWLTRYRRLWNDRLDALETLLAEELTQEKEHSHDHDDRQDHPHDRDH